MYELALAAPTLKYAAALDYVDAAAFAGFSLIGLRLHPSPGMPHQPLAEDASLRAQVRRRISDAGLRVLDINSFYMTPQTDVAAFAPVVELAASLDARYLLVMGADPDWSRMSENFAAMCDLAAGHGLCCAIECMATQPLANLAQALRLVRETARDNAAICVDPLNFSRAGDVVADLRQFDSRLLPFAQLTDGTFGPDEADPAWRGRTAPNQKSLLGHGVVPLNDILDALPRSIPLSVEIPPPEGSALSSREWAGLVHDNARNFLSKRSLACTVQVRLRAR